MTPGLHFLIAALLAGSAEDPPNVVLILADDMGAPSVAAFNPHLGIPTPNLDRLVAEGMTFDDAHSTSAVCSPTRYGLLTGRYSWRTRLKAGIVNRWEGPLIADERRTIAELLREEGYATACVGKWHLGWDWPKRGGGVTRKPAEIDYTRPISGGPLAHGFDHYLGDDVPNWPPYVWIDDERARAVPTATMPEDGANGVRVGPMTPGWSLEAVLPALAARCADYVTERAAEDAPFFLFFSMTSPHTPINPAEEFAGATGKGRYADFLVETDWAVGEVLNALDESGVADDTLVIFLADNGTSPKCDFEGLAQQGADLRQHWRGHKADLWEGGHRVPFVVRWPGVVPAGSVSHEVVSSTDVFATVADVVGREPGPNEGEDSVSLLPALRREEYTAPLHALVVHQSSLGFFAVRRGSWKLLFCRGSGGWSAPKEGPAKEQGLPEVQLYDLAADPGEHHNLAAEHPELVAELTAAFREIVERGRSTPGPPAANDGPEWWAKLPWPKPE